MCRVVSENSISMCMRDSRRLYESSVFEGVSSQELVMEIGVLDYACLRTNIVLTLWKYEERRRFPWHLSRRTPGSTSMIAQLK